MVWVFGEDVPWTSLWGGVEFNLDLGGSSLVGRTVASQQEGSGTFRCGVCMFSPSMCGFPQCSLGCSHLQKQGGICDSKLSFVMNVSVNVYFSFYMA